MGTIRSLGLRRNWPYQPSTYEEILVNFITATALCGRRIGQAASRILTRNCGTDQGAVFSDQFLFFLFVPVKLAPNPPELTRQMKKLIKYIVRYVDE